MRKVDSKGIFLFGIVFLCLEIFKQSYLYYLVFNGHYDIWYLPFQLCSMPIYLCLIYGIVNWGKENNSYKTNNAKGHMLMTFLQDYGLLGGAMALIVRDGFTFPDHIVLTVHGYIWHAGMILLSLYIFFNKLSDTSLGGFIKGTIVYLVTAAMALGLNIKLHEFGDADMYYISPYHLSTQPIFSEIEGVTGRFVGIGIYIVATIIGALIAHFLFWVTSKLMD